MGRECVEREKTVSKRPMTRLSKWLRTITVFVAMATAVNKYWVKKCKEVYVSWLMKRILNQMLHRSFGSVLLRAWSDTRNFWSRTVSMIPAGSHYTKIYISCWCKNDIYSWMINRYTFIVSEAFGCHYTNDIYLSTLKKLTCQMGKYYRSMHIRYCHRCTQQKL